MCMAVVGQLLSMDAETGWAVMEVDGVPRHVSLALLLVEGNPIAIGDWVRAHTGLALQRIEEQEARAEMAAALEMRQEAIG